MNLFYYITKFNNVNAFRPQINSIKFSQISTYIYIEIGIDIEIQNFLYLCSVNECVMS